VQKINTSVLRRRRSPKFTSIRVSKNRSYPRPKYMR